MKKAFIINILLMAFLIMTSCSDDKSPLKNDYIKRTTGPLIVGETIEFAYAMGTTEGKLKMAIAEASVAGMSGTGFENVTWRTEAGKNISTIVARDCKTEGNTSSAHIIDAQATTLRYHYIIPEELRGKEVTFTFTCESGVDERTSLRTETYKISEMDMNKQIVLGVGNDDKRYISIEDMQAYTISEVEVENLYSKIDFIYAYAAKKTVGTTSYDYKHAFFSPAAVNYYPDGFSLPATWAKKNSTLMEKKLYVWDGQLKNDVNTNIYVDDLDMQAKGFDNALNFILDLRQDGSAFMKTEDGKYCAFIYINALPSTNASATIGIKRYKY